METNDYGKFDFFNQNRPISQGLVERLKKSIHEVGYINGRPVLVNSRFLILDGQHRFIACKELGLPIIYEIQKGDEDKVILALNTNQKSWSLKEFVNMHAKNGLREYQYLQMIDEKYNLGISNTLSICVPQGGDDRGRSIRNGEKLKLNPRTEQICEFVLSCHQVSFYKTQKFVQALTYLISKVSKADLQKLHKKILTVPQMAKATDYLSVFENIINKHRKTKITLRQL